MNIIVLTSSMIDEDFSLYSKEAKIKPNPSNQNFYNKLIKSLSINNNVAVISHRPFIKGMFTLSSLEGKVKYDGAVPYYYTRISSNSSYKTFSETKEICGNILKAIDSWHTNDFVILVDTLRRGLVKAAMQIRKQYMNPVIGICTDNPKNISGINGSNARKMIKRSSDMDGYLCLTDKLNYLFNFYSRPNYIFEGLVEDIPEYKKYAMENYMFFAGSLYEKYGVKNLIDAFHESTLKCKLVVAGSGPLSSYLNQMALKDNRFVYFAQLPKIDVYNLSQHAIANINPRPFVEKYDRESVPSKLLDYLAVGVPTISTIHTKTKELIQNDVLWVEDSSKEGLLKALNSFESNDYKELIKKAKNANLRVHEFYGLNVQCEMITHFLKSLIKPNNLDTNLSLDK